MVKQLEVSLYKSAPSFDVYRDVKTLKSRLQQLAQNINLQSQARSSSRRASHSRNEIPNNPPHHQSATLPNINSQQRSRTSSQQSQPQVRSIPQMHPQQHGGRILANGLDINQGISNDVNNMQSANSDSPSFYPAPLANETKQGVFGSQGGINMSAVTNTSTTPVASWSQSRYETDKVQQKQQRLLLLHHSSKCPVKEGETCSMSPHCAHMKKLWKHMARCRDQQCRVQHCFSSRSILSHYKKCQDQQCPSCGPVRDEVKRAQERESEASLPDAILRPDSRSSSANSQQNYYPSRQQEGILFSNNTTDNISPLNSNRPVPFAEIHGAFADSNNYAPTMQQASTNMFSGTAASLPPNGFLPLQQPLSTRAPLNANGSNDWGSQQQQDAESKDKVKTKQQRLLLLRHASKCQYENGQCPVTPNCGTMKQLWRHIAECKEQRCDVQHCISSRYVLSHYRKCKDSKCPSCEPVRQTLRLHQGRPDEPQPHHSSSNDSTREMKRPKMLDASPSELVCKPVSYPPPSRHFSETTMLAHNLPSEPSSIEPAISRELPAAAASSNGELMSTSSVIASSPLNPQPIPAKSVSSIPSEAKSSAPEITPNPQDVYSLLESFTIEQIKTHTLSLNRMLDLPPVKLKARCMEILKPLQNHQNGWVFNVPVDPVELNLPDYFEVIKRPMDLGTVQRRLDSGNFHSLEDFVSDVNLTFDNAMTYNQEGSVVYNMAKEMKDQFAADYQKLLVQLKKEDDERRKNEKACTLCGCEKLLFEPPVYFCNGLNCASNRIRRNSHYYVGGNNQYYWCNQCYNELKETEPIELMDMTIKKADLKKKKNDEVHEESWVECEVCNHWIHQICALFNSRQNTKEHTKEYHCPHCLLKKSNEGSKAKREPMPKPLMAEDLPRTKLSQWLEYHVRKKVKEHREACINDHLESAGAAAEVAMHFDVADHITIRQVTAMDQKVEVRERMLKRYKNYPAEFPYRCKCIVVFQNLDGVDVLLFALYVYEHGPDNEAPNKRVVYISYLDSVHFMRPRKLRTFVYHEILIAYLDYARKKGFCTAHIWACPPLKGDDYIFYAKPKDQKTPRDDRLRQWYIDMLVECQKREICGRVTNMYDHYFSGKSNNATVLPYLEGDYFPGEAENIIKELDEGGVSKRKSSGKKTKKKKGEDLPIDKDEKKSKSKTRCTRATGGDESESDSDDNGIVADPVMVKLGETIKPMKESFIVAFLNWEGARPEEMVVPNEIVEFREKRRAESEKGKKRDLNGLVREEPIDSSITRNYVKDSRGRTVKVIDDDNDDLDCEFFNNRQSFLNLCRGNHYQFDELRRAKHTSMMVLWHLHNRDAPKFVQQCAACNREILSGVRHHCSTCTPDFDLCDECFKNPRTDRGTCNHNLEAIAVEGTQSSGTSKLTAAAREERQRSIKLHIQLLEHASGCNSGTCTSNNCQKMKGFLNHERQCQVRSFVVLYLISPSLHYVQVNKVLLG